MTNYCSLYCAAYAAESTIQTVHTDMLKNVCTICQAIFKVLCTGIIQIMFHFVCIEKEMHDIRCESLQMIKDDRNRLAIIFSLWHYRVFHSLKSFAPFKYFSTSNHVLLLTEHIMHDEFYKRRDHLRNTCRVTLSFCNWTVLRWL